MISKKTFGWFFFLVVFVVFVMMIYFFVFDKELVQLRDSCIQTWTEFTWVESLNTSVPSILEDVQKNLVRIKAEKYVKYLLEDSSSLQPGLVHEYRAKVGQGKGVFLNSRFVLTSKHVVDDSKATYFVQTPLWKTIQVQYTYFHKTKDLALLMLLDSYTGNLTDLDFVTSSDQIQVGNLMLWFGFMDEKNLVRWGMLSSDNINFELENGKMYEHMAFVDMTLDDGDSGGPLLTLDWKIWGLATAVDQFENQGVFVETFDNEELTTFMQEIWKSEY